MLNIQVNDRNLQMQHASTSNSIKHDTSNEADISCRKFLLESFDNLNRKYETLFSELKYIREENLVLKTEVSKLRKELEIVTCIKEYSLAKVPLVDDDKGLGDLSSKLSTEKAAKFSFPFSKQIACSMQEEKNHVISGLALLRWRRHVLCGLAIMIILIGLTITLVLLNSSDNSDQDKEELSGNYSERLVSRKYWLALPEKSGVLKYKKQPLDLVMVGHTAGSECSLTEACQALVRTLQADAFSRGWSDISYNFFLGGDGYIYEGRGWDKVATHTLHYNNISLGVAFMGNFVRDPPLKKQLTAFQILLNEGVSLGKLNPDYKILLQKQVQSTESPGAALIPILMKCSHWSEAPLKYSN